MDKKNRLPDRRSIRLKGYDYTQTGGYFVTICTENRKPILGEIINGSTQLNVSGSIVASTWRWLPEQYPHVKLDAWVVMPNHFHGILFLSNDLPGGSRTAPTKGKSLGRLIGAFKTVSTKRINEIQGTHARPFWQRNYYEHVIRNETDLEEIREYIQHNPLKWLEDENHPFNIEK
jgi:REP element-mobilizing transposase RayT